MAAMTRTEDQRTIDRTLIASMLRRGRPRRQIVDHFMTRDITEGPRISYNMVLYDIKQVMEEYKREREADNEAILSTALEELREVKHEAWLQWEESKKPVTRRDREGNEYQGDPEPDERWLRLVFDCVKEECDLQGVKLPTIKEKQDEQDVPGLLEFLLPLVKQAVEKIGMSAQGPQIVLGVVDQLKEQGERNTGVVPPVPYVEEGVLPETADEEPVEVDAEGSLENFMKQQKPT